MSLYDNDFDELEHMDMMELLTLANIVGWDNDRLLRACHNLLLLDESLDYVFEESPLKLVKDYDA